MEKFEREIKYVFDFIFKTLGFEYKYVSKIPELKENDILFFYGLVPLSLQEAYFVAFRKIIFFVPFEADLYKPQKIGEELLKEYLREIRLSHPIPIFSKEKFKSPVNCSVENEIYYGVFNFDFFGNIFFHLSRIKNPKNEEQVNSQLAKYVRFPFVNSLLWILEQFIYEAVREKKEYYIFKKEFWPNAEKFAVVISHNIDKLQKWNFSGYLKSFVTDLFYIYKLKYFFRELFRKIKFLFTNMEEYWNFSLIEEMEREHHIKSTFFLGTENNAREDVDYNTEDVDLQEEISKILKSGKEISLLASYYSYKSDIHKKQKDRLLQITKENRCGVRQKDFKYDINFTPHLHNKHGFIYDSSLAYNDYSGFFNGIGFPFYVFVPTDSLQNRNVGHIRNCPEIPLTFSDETLKISRTEQVSFDDAKNIIDSLFQSVESVNGLLGFDFSLSNFADVLYDEKLFSRVLEKISGKHIFKATYREISDWWKLRNSVMFKEISKNKIEIYFPERTKNFTISFTGDGKFEISESELVSTEGNLIKFHNVPADTTFEITVYSGEKDR